MPASDIAAIEAVLHTYLDGLHEGDADKLASAFHPCAHLYSDKEGVVQDLPRDTWLEWVRGRGSPKAMGLPRDDRILMLDQSGPETALAKVACQIPPRYFTDYLCLLRVDGRWRVAQKLYTTQPRP
jgi:Putative lumazine-binding